MPQGFLMQTPCFPDGRHHACKFLNIVFVLCAVVRCLSPILRVSRGLRQAFTVCHIPGFYEAARHTAKNFQKAVCTVISLLCLLIGLAIFVVSIVCKFVWWLLGLCTFFIAAAILIIIRISSVLILPVCLAASIAVGGRNNPY